MYSESSGPACVQSSAVLHSPDVGNAGAGKASEKEITEKDEEKEILSSTQMIHSEKNRHGEVGKYLESISHSVSDQVKKMAYFNAHIWGL